ncbi:MULTISPECIES: N-acetylmuramoyl-L-alanine amidase [unclassified Clostridium]|uniref:N-acetylmuramoyl-L-alanine amidase n=1 Tax=unclassified Clostridium TaxID=2614128 RepID=UPI001C8B8D79|nr:MULTISPECIES: N-acetylmuramoyl-L-alanine amidase [unclassified Clostridium]MBX9136736.1 N-acetylmuramoyl-L-alanine amidase [Clostridium sp. K12(2020)]MBX9145161.1 N-acetylmuramoyl-L-alanine amidase [Clostridium sp. K13]
MKIAVRGGHCPKVTGASALIDELTEDRKVKDAVIKYLKKLGHTVLDVTPPDSTSSSSSDLSYGVNQANNWGAELFVSIHFNNAYNTYNGAIGSEVCVYSNIDVAKRVVDGLGSLGFKNRGQKVRTGLYELKNTKMKSMIIEVCFVEATEDVVLYRRLGADAVGKNIAESIANKKIPHLTNNTSDTGEIYYRCIAGSFKEKDNAEKRKYELEAKGFTGVFLEAFKK